MFRRAKVALAVGVAGTSTLVALFAAPASADPQARPSDAVGVGSDTAQYGADFLMDGDVSGHAGYNQGKANRVYNEFATGDGNGRALYDSKGNLIGVSSSGSPNGTSALALRAGAKPVQRPDGSGDGIAALIADSLGGTGYQGLPKGSISFARASRLPKASENSTCQSNPNCGGLHVFQFATDALAMGKWSGGTSNAVPLSAAQLKTIYSCGGTGPSGAVLWNAVGGTSPDPIDAVIPQSGSGTRNFFLADIGLSAPGACVRTSQEHDPTGITKAVNPADAIEPFSVGRLKLIQANYFTNTQEPASDFQVADVTTGTPSDSGAVYNSAHGVYFIARDHDLNAVAANFDPTSPDPSLHAAQPGGTSNWVQTLFLGSTSWIARSTNAPLIASAGFTAGYQDLGDATSG
jgi:ABC-type phosphate transport system substrate-binding protein